MLALLAAYVALTVLVLVPHSPLLDFDRYCVELHLWSRHPAWYPWLDNYVIFGQRGPATLAFLPFFLWLAWRQRSTRPLVVLVTALIWLNLSVGVVKYAIGRVGPMGNNDVHKIFDFGANIYPSGHVSNAVVLYGLIAWLAPRFRKTLTVIAVLLSVTVGLATVYLRTHWFSDVVGGWIAGALVLVTLPYLLPTAQRWTDRLEAWLRAWWSARRAQVSSPVAPSRAEVPVTYVAAPITPARANGASEYHRPLAGASSRATKR